MLKYIHRGCLVLLISLVSLSAFAAEEEKFFGTGSYCSAASLDGYWGFFFGPFSLYTNCARVQNGLWSVTSFPAHSWNRGYYQLYGLNTVWVSCNHFNQTFHGYGELPLHEAFSHASFFNGQSCIFSVSY